MIALNWKGGEIILGAEVSVLRAVFCSGLSSRKKTEGLWESGVSQGPQASGPEELVCAESGVFSGAIFLCQGMAAEKEI